MYHSGAVLYWISSFIRVEMALALLHPHQQHQQTNMFLIDFEEDGGIYEVEVDMVSPGCLLVMNENLVCLDSRT